MSSVFTVEEGRLLNKYILGSCKMHFGLTYTQVRRLAYEYANDINIKHPSSWDTNKMAGVDWLAIYANVIVNLSLQLRLG